MRKTWWGWAHIALSVAYYAIWAISSFVAAFLSIDLSQEHNEWVQSAARFSQKHGWWFLLAAGFIATVLQELRLRIGSPAVWRQVHDLLDQFRDRVFGDEQDPDSLHHHNRVTLFKRVRFCICFRSLNPRSWRQGIVPWSGWLVPVERSGHTTRRSKVVFRAPDNADEAEGVAGRTWAKNGVVSAHRMPDLSVEKPSTRQLSRYARKGFVRIDWLQKQLARRRRKGDCPSRAFCGIPVEVKGKLWGVIVLDTRADKEIRQDAVQEFYDVIAPTLTRLLERA